MSKSATFDFRYTSINMLAIFTVIGIAFTVVVAQYLYYRYLHPLSGYPGPFLASFSDLWYVISHTLYPLVY